MHRKQFLSLLLLALFSFARGAHDFQNCLSESMTVGNKDTGASYIDDISIRQLTAYHEPYYITSCFTANSTTPSGMTGLRIQSGIYDSEKKMFKDLVTLSSHGNPDGENCKKIRLDPSTNKIIASIDVYYDESGIQGLNFKYQTGENSLVGYAKENFKKIQLFTRGVQKKFYAFTSTSTLERVYSLRSWAIDTACVTALPQHEQNFSGLHPKEVNLQYKIEVVPENRAEEYRQVSGDGCFKEFKESHGLTNKGIYQSDWPFTKNFTPGHELTTIHVCTNDDGSLRGLQF